MTAPCPDCGTIDERGPHTSQNCRGVLRFRASVLLAEADAAKGEAAAARARTLELESRFPVTPCPKCGTLGKRGHAHMHAFVTGSHVEQRSCAGLE